MMGGPWVFVVTVMIRDDKAVPPTCRVRFGKAELLDAKGAVEARLGPADLTLQSSPTPQENSQGRLAMMYVSSQGGLIASLPLVSVLGMVWLWKDTHDPVRMASHAQATVWFVLPSLPMFLLIPFLLRQGVGFWLSLLAGCLLTMALYALMIWAAPRIGLKL